MKLIDTEKLLEKMGGKREVMSGLGCSDIESISYNQLHDKVTKIVEEDSFEMECLEEDKVEACLVSKSCEEYTRKTGYPQKWKHFARAICARFGRPRVDVKLLTQTIQKTSDKYTDEHGIPPMGFFLNQLIVEAIKTALEGGEK